ncbi:hypothetical protein [Pseudomonas huanghezhanensis]|uniref:hypothetical protein n=1 Tax=Pseudomonas huanghezhanensis TaxID=3002903 RepID=UPI0038B544D5
MRNSRYAFIKSGFGDSSYGSILLDVVRSMLGRKVSPTTDHVEVLKGPASLLYGAIDPGCLINVVSKQPQFTRSTTLSGSSFSEGGGTAGFDTTGQIGDSNFASASSRGIARDQFYIGCLKK